LTSNGVEIGTFTFERSIRAEVATYRLDVAFGSLYTQQLHGFDKLRNDQGIIKKTTPSMNCVTTKVSFRIAVPRSTQQSHHFICPQHLSLFEFFD
jgi:hypothetical protein